MIKIYKIQIPLSFEQSYELIRKSGDDIVSWGKSNANPESGYIDWKQSFWSLTGNTLISAQLERKQENETVVSVTIHKPMQVIDPLGICRKVFKKLSKSLERNIASSDEYRTLTITIE